MLEQLAIAVSIPRGCLDLTGGVEHQPELLGAGVELPGHCGAARDHEVVALTELDAPKDGAQHTAAAMHVDHLVALAVAIEAFERLDGLTDRHLQVAVEHQHLAARQRVATGLHPAQVGQSVDVRLWVPGAPLEAPQGPHLRDPARRAGVIQDRLVAREPLVAHHFFDQQGSVIPELRVALERDLTERRVPHELHPRTLRDPSAHRFPRFSCSRSIASKSALKLPSPKPRAPWRSISSKKIVGLSPRGAVKICSRYPSSSRSTRIPSR